MTGLLALVGGREHSLPCEPIDRRLLAEVDRDPVVAVVPLASSMRTRARTVGRAVGWWERLDVTTVVVGPDLDGARRLLDRADIVVLTGGVPDRLHRRMLRQGLHERIAARWRSGAHVMGSSSGAMVVGGWRQSVVPPFGVVRGFGFVPDLAVAPHHELAAPRALATARARTHPHTLIVGIDEMTGLVGRDGAFEVLGAGGVVVRRGTWSRRYTSGDVVELERFGVQVRPVTRALRAVPELPRHTSEEPA